MMGVKSTQELTRKEAEDLYVQLRAKISNLALFLSDKDLEDELEFMNDWINDGQGFANYVIIRDS